jgi:hypothetical protein
VITIAFFILNQVLINSLDMIDIDTKAVLTRKEKEEVVLDLYFNQNKTIREIAKTARK